MEGLPSLSELHKAMNFPKLKTVRVTNFQAIEDTEIELGALTVLVGEGDVGKSSFIRAIRAAFLNDGNDLDIRHDTQQCSVVLTFDDGTVIRWNKVKGKGGTYWMDKDDITQEYTKCGGKVPDAIALFLGIGVIEVDSTTELTPQLSDQHDQPFILWQPGSRRARIIGKATRLDVVVTAQMACKKRLDSLRRDLTASTDAAVETNDAIQALPPFQGIGKKVGECATTLHTVFRNLKLADRMAGLSQSITKHKGVRQATLELPDVKETLSKATTALNRANKMAKLSPRITEMRSRQATLDLTAAKATLSEVPLALNRAGRLMTLATYFEHHKKTEEELEGQLNKARGGMARDLEVYQDLCEQEGVCPDCEGLLDHARCEG